MGFWRDYEALLSSYEAGDIARTELFGALLGMLDLVDVERLAQRLPLKLVGPFLQYVDGFLASGDAMRNVETGGALPLEVIGRLRQWRNGFVSDS